MSDPSTPARGDVPVARYAGWFPDLVRRQVLTWSRRRRTHRHPHDVRRRGRDLPRRRFGKFVRPGVTSWRGSLFYETASAKLAQLNGIAGGFEYEVDEGGKSEG